jgi:hypothetical protein
MYYIPRSGSYLLSYRSLVSPTYVLGGFYHLFGRTGFQVLHIASCSLFPSLPFSTQQHRWLVQSSQKSESFLYRGSRFSAIVFCSTIPYARCPWILVPRPELHYGSPRWISLFPQPFDINYLSSAIYTTSEFSRHASMLPRMLPAMDFYLRFLSPPWTPHPLSPTLRLTLLLVIFCLPLRAGRPDQSGFVISTHLWDCPETAHRPATCTFRRRIRIGVTTSEAWKSLPVEENYEGMVGGTWIACTVCAGYRRIGTKSLVLASDRLHTSGYPQCKSLLPQTFTPSSVI